MEETIMSIARPDAREATMMHFLAEREKRGVYCQKRYAGIYGRKVDTAAKRLTENLKNFVKHCSREKVIVEEHGLGTEGRIDTVMGMSTTALNVLTLPSMRKKLISVDEMRFRTYVTNAFGSLNDHCVGQVPDDGHIALPGIPTKIYKDNKKAK